MKYSLSIYLLASVVSLLVGLFSLRRKSISLSGFAALTIISNGIIWLDEIALLFALFYMFASSSILTSFQKRYQREVDTVVNKSGPRDYIQALANLGVATSCIVIYHFTKHPYYLIALLGSVAASNADSWASEIGTFSKKTPISIINMKPLPKGVSGGITLLGTLGGFAGSGFIVVASLFTIQLIEPLEIPLFPIIFASCLAGFFGMLFDSILGALFQALYKTPQSLQLTEIASGNVMVKGYKWMDNDFVNFLCTLFGGVVAVSFYLVIN